MASAALRALLVFYRISNTTKDKGLSEAFTFLYFVTGCHPFYVVFYKVDIMVDWDTLPKDLFPQNELVAAVNDVYPQFLFS